MCVCVYMMRNIEVFVTSRRAVLLIFFYDSILPRFPPTSKPSPHAQSTTTVHTFTAFHHAAHDTLKRDYVLITQNTPFNHMHHKNTPKVFNKFQSVKVVNAPSTQCLSPIIRAFHPLRKGILYIYDRGNFK